MTDIQDNILKLNYSGEILLFDFKQKGKNIAHYTILKKRKEGIYIIIN